MNYTTNRTFYVIEVAPSRFLDSYLPEGRSNTTPYIFNPYESNTVGRDIEGYNIWGKRFKNEDAFWAYVSRRGSKEDFLEWCKCLRARYGGDGKPRIRKVTATLTADIGDGVEISNEMEGESK